MTDSEEQFYECPICSYYIKFRYDDGIGKYVSFCPYCKERLEIDKNEFENDSNDSIERYFEFE